MAEWHGIILGLFIGGLDMRESLHEKPLTWGVRAEYRRHRIVGIESEITIAPENPSGNFGQTLFMAGPRAGVRVGPVGVAAKVAGGMIHMGGPPPYSRTLGTTRNRTGSAGLQMRF